MTTKTNASKSTKHSAKGAKSLQAKKDSGRHSGAKEKKKLSALAAAARVLGETKEPMSCPELIAVMTAKGYWSSPAGKTPQATLSAAIQREIVVKKGQSRFKKTAPGRYMIA
jgi:hypothetical protein